MNTENENILDGEETIKIKLTRDLLKAAGAGIGRAQARFLVDYYYQAQEDRLANAGRIRSMGHEPTAVLAQFMNWNESMEQQIRAALNYYAKSEPMGQWALRVTGIGPVIAAGLVAHIDISKCPTVGHIWRFAGLDPTSKWLGGERASALVAEVVGKRGKPTDEQLHQLADLAGRSHDSVLGACSGKTRAEVVAWLAKRPWNAALKVLCWKAGESFIKVKNNPEDKYGKLYDERKAYEQQKNEAGDYADQAEAGAARVGKTTEAWKHYSEGKLPPGHIHARARRYVVKQFLADWHGEAYRLHFGEEPPKPYAIAILGHAHLRPPLHQDQDNEDDGTNPTDRDMQSE